MTTTQIGIIAGAVSSVAGLLAVLAPSSGAEDGGLIGPALIMLALLSAGVLGVGVVGVSSLVMRRAVVRSKRHARRATTLLQVGSYS